jgi:CO/xanthine dehydrogenase FAD-binding subunit
MLLVPTLCTVGAMVVHMPRSVDEAVALLDVHADLTEDPDAEVTLLAGGTDLMVEVNDGHRRPRGAVVVVNRIPELRSWRRSADGSQLVIGAAVSYRELEQGPLATLVPALAQASRTVGSPQIRNAGTLGGNLGTCSPAGDGLPVLAALDATIELASVRGRRTMAVGEFMTGVKQNALEPDELIVSVTVPIIDGWQGYAKVGVRNAMVIAVASACVVLDRRERSVGIALGSVGPTIVRCSEAEALLSESIDWQTLEVVADVGAEVGRVAANQARPITDHRSTAEYRRHAVGVLVQRLLRRASTGEVAA